MVYLTLYRIGKNNRQNRVTLEFRTVHEAVKFGQQSGQDYEIFDPASGRNIDWNEINTREEEEWYYDESEMSWKKNSQAFETINRIYSISFPWTPVHAARVA